MQTIIKKKIAISGLFVLLNFVPQYSNAQTRALTSDQAVPSWLLRKCDLEQMQKNLGARTSALGESNPEVLEMMDALAKCYNAFSMHDKALSLNEKTLQINRFKFGVEHPDTLMSMNNMAETYNFLKIYDKALYLQEEILNVERTKFGEVNPFTLKAIDNLAKSYIISGQNERALTLKEKTLESLRKRLGTGENVTQAAMIELAGFYGTNGKSQKAVALEEEILQVKRTKLGEYHRETTAAMTNLYKTYTALSMHDKALALKEKILLLSQLPRSQLDMLIDAAKEGNVAWLQNNPVAKTLANERDPSGYSALHYAAANNHAAAVKWLLRAGANPAISTPLGMTPLLLAVRNESISAVTELLRSDKTNVNEQFPLLSDITPLTQAILQGNGELIALLLKHGANPNLRSESGNAIHYFARMKLRSNEVNSKNRVSTIGRALLEAHADINDRSSDGRTPLMTAVTDGNLNTIAFIVEHGGEVNAVDNKGNTAFSLADIKSARYLLSKGASADTGNTR